jgi:hypothetical protein
MAAKRTQGEAIQPVNHIGIIRKAGSLLIRKGVLIAIGASLVLPACKSHKHCDAYSNSTIKRHGASGSVYSMSQNQAQHPG